MPLRKKSQNVGVMDPIFIFVITALCGVGVGILSGLLGIGGGTVMIPLFRLLFGMSALASTATSLFAIVPTSLSGVVAHIRNKTCYIGFGVAAGVGGACTSPVGVWFANQSPGWLIITATAVVIIYSASTMLYKAIRYKPESATATVVAASTETPAPTAVTDGEQPEADRRTFTKKQYAGAFVLGAFVGVLAGFVGLGGGFIMVPLLVSLYRMPMKYVSGTSLITVMILAIPGVITHAAFGNIDLLAGIAISAGAIPGAFIGARLVQYVPDRILRLVFGCFLIVVAVILIINEYVFA